MANIIRRDSQTIITQPYRELVRRSNRTLLKNEIVQLAQTHGEFIRLKNVTQRQVEVTCAPQAGYCLGDAIWEHCNKPSYLLYCEAWHDQYLVVVVKQGLVYLDALLTRAQVQSDVVPILAEGRFAVHCVGQIPIAQKDAAGVSFVLPASQVRSWQQHSDSIIEKMALPKSLLCRPVADVLCDLNAAKWRTSIIVATLLLLPVLSLWPLQPQHVQRLPQSLVSALQRFEIRSNTPDVGWQINEIVTDLGRAMLLPGWDVTQIHYQPQGAQLILESRGGTITTLLQWVAEQHCKVALTAHGAAVWFASDLPLRPLQQLIPPQLQTLAVLVDTMTQVIPKHPVTIGNTRTHFSFRETATRLQVTRQSPDAMQIIAKQLSGLPLRLQQADINVNNGLLSGTISLTVIGS